MLALVTCEHIYRLLNQVEIVLLERCVWAKVKITIYESLAAGIEKCINIGLVPARLLQRLKLCIQIKQPVLNIAVVWLKSVIPGCRIERRNDLQ